MFLDRLESGFLLFETRQGLVRVELSFQQRVYLLWTFRHFHQLSMLLLNSHERAFVNNLFRHNIGVVSQPDDSWPVIGVIENFVPPAVQIDHSPSEEREPRQEREYLQEEEPQPEGERQPEEVAAYTPEAPQSDRGSFSLPRLAWARLATAVGALSLCILCVAAWHRIQRVPSSQANEPRVEQVNAIAPQDVPHSTQPAVIDESPIAITQPTADSKAAVKPVSIATVISKPKRAPRVGDTDSVPTLPGQESGIQASRPPLRVVYPVYPSVRVRGGVALRAVVDSEGVVRTVHVVSGNRALAAAAVRAVRQWRYRPYLKDGQAVATETNIFISFIAEDAISMSFPPSFPANR